MTENEIKETKEWLQDFIRTFGCNFDDLETRGFNECVVCLKELLQYRAIGTIEEFKALKEKNEPKKPRFYAHNYYCTECGNLVGNNEFEWQRFLYCDKCGQKLDWE